MKAKRNLEEFGALSRDPNANTGVRGSAPGRLQPRPTPECVRDFSVHQHGSAGSELTQPERPGVARHCATARKLPVKFERKKRAARCKEVV